VWACLFDATLPLKGNLLSFKTLGIRFREQARNYVVVCSILFLARHQLMIDFILSGRSWPSALKKLPVFQNIPGAETVLLKFSNQRKYFYLLLLVKNDWVRKTYMGRLGTSLELIPVHWMRVFFFPVIWGWHSGVLVLRILESSILAYCWFVHFCLLFICNSSFRFSNCYI